MSSHGDSDDRRPPAAARRKGLNFAPQPLATHGKSRNANPSTEQERPLLPLEERRARVRQEHTKYAAKPQFAPTNDPFPSVSDLGATAEASNSFPVSQQQQQQQQQQRNHDRPKTQDTNDWRATMRAPAPPKRGTGSSDGRPGSSGGFTRRRRDDQDLLPNEVYDQFLVTRTTLGRFEFTPKPGFEHMTPPKAGPKPTATPTPKRERQPKKSSKKKKRSKVPEEIDPKIFEVDLDMYLDPPKKSSKVPEALDPETFELEPDMYLNPPDIVNGVANISVSDEISKAQVEGSSPAPIRQPRGPPSDQPATPAKQNRKSAHDTPHGKAPYFEEHIGHEAALEGVQQGKFYRGLLRISAKARNDAWISVITKEFNDDILLEGDAARNRALNGDDVVVEVTSKPSSDLTEREGRFADRYRGKVVCILERRPLERISGILHPPGYNVSQDKMTDDRTLIQRAQGKRYCLFDPTDTRIPFMEIHENDLPADMRGPNMAFNVLQKRKTIFAVRLLQWEAQRRFPHGAVVAELGGVGEIEAETAAILADCDVDTRDHPAAALADLPDMPWRISEEEIAKRRDFRTTRVVTIDPETARDLDDALSVKPLGNGKWEIGVHIADVSHFVKPDTKLDEIAQSRATTVYMVQRAIPMLPRLLCEELCSLNPAVDRLAFSVTWTLDADGKEVGPRWYGRSVIRSCVRFAYGQAQAVLDGKPWEEAVGKPVDGGHSQADVLSDLQVLLRMSKAMRQRRFAGGALTISAFKLNFRLNRDGLPQVAEVYELKDTNRLIEEFMLFANISVAERITDAFPAHALLRMHPEPKDRPLQQLVQYAAKLGIHLDTSSSHSLQEAFQDLAARAKDDPIVGILNNNAVRSMRRAEYICTGLHEDPDSWKHYALAVPLYTHFTSPIRRYADVVVHRLLQAAIDSVTDPGFEPEACESWAKNCNLRKENSRTAQERSSLLYLCAWVEQKCEQTGHVGPDDGMYVDAIVTAVLDRSVDIVIPSLALDKRIYYNASNLSLAQAIHNPQEEKVDLLWRTPTDRQNRIALRLKEAGDAKEKARPLARGEIRGEKDTSQKYVPGSDTTPTPDQQHPQQPPQAEEDLTPTVKTTLKALDKIVVWIRGDFSSSPCEIVAGFVSPVLQ
ncbi:hypothetical protein PYCC9005_005948 [Savitreella phatthalungensis]